MRGSSAGRRQGRACGSTASSAARSALGSPAPPQLRARGAAPRRGVVRAEPVAGASLWARARGRRCARWPSRLPGRGRGLSLRHLARSTRPLRCGRAVPPHALANLTNGFLKTQDVRGQQRGSGSRGTGRRERARGPASGYRGLARRLVGLPGLLELMCCFPCRFWHAGRLLLPSSGTKTLKFNVETSSWSWCV